MITILLLGGLQMLFLGIIGEYLWRTLDQVRQRPPYLVKNRYGFDEPSGGRHDTERFVTRADSKFGPF